MSQAVEDLNVQQLGHQKRGARSQSHAQRHCWETGNIPDWAQGAVPLLGAGIEMPLWASLAVADWLVKLSLALIALVPFRFTVLYLVGRMTKNH